MDKQSIIEQISPEIYTLESEDAGWYGSQTNNPNGLFYSSDTLHAIDSLIWDAANELTDGQKLLLMFSIYEDLPGYGLLMLNWSRYQHFDPPAQALYWSEIRRILSQGDATWAEPMEYHLELDWFELCSNCDAIWHSLTHEANSALLASVMRSSGTAAWYLKAPLYDQLIADVRWHELIYASLHASYYRLYGQIDKHEALGYLQQLVVADQDQALARLINAFQSGERYTNASGKAIQQVKKKPI